MDLGSSQERTPEPEDLEARLGAHPESRSSVRPPDFAGWLRKQNHSLPRSFVKRWCELYGTELRYYDHQSGQVACRVINLHGSQILSHSETSNGSQIKVNTPNDALASQYTFAGDDSAEINRWKEAIEAAAAHPPNRDSVVKPGNTNLIALVNGKSGGKQGLTLIRKIKKHLGDNNVVDITAVGGPKTALTAHAQMIESTRFLVCGGDGTVGWALFDQDRVQNQGVMRGEASFAVLPLGTGNDMARILKCGGGYGGEKLMPILKKAVQSDTQRLDRWKVSAKSADGTGKDFLLCNYFSIGYDAKVARQWHVCRETKPYLFRSRPINLAWYGYFGALNAATMSRISNALKLEVDGQEVKIPGSIRTLCVVNIPSYSGGANLWGKAHAPPPFRAQATDDKLIEVVGTTGPIHLLGAKMGILRGIRVAQGRKVKVSARKAAEGGKQPKKGLYFQVDGEPFVVDHAGLHEDVKFKPEMPPQGAEIDLTVDIEYHKDANLVAHPYSVSCGACGGQQ